MRNRFLWIVGAAFASAVGFGGCTNAHNKNSQTSSAASADRGQSRSPADSARTLGRSSGLGCLALQPEQVTLRGVVRKEQRLGAPGYGETPKLDKKDTILVLRADDSVSVCADTTSRQDAKLSGLRDIQLMGHVDNIDALLGQEITVRGTLFVAELAWQYTPVVLRVDQLVSPTPVTRRQAAWQPRRAPVMPAPGCKKRNCSRRRV